MPTAAKPTLSKSKLLACRQCTKRLWLEVHRKDLKQDSATTVQNFSVGNEVGEIAQQIYDPKGKGVLINAQEEGFEQAFARTQTLLESEQPIFEAGFKASGALAFADVLLPVKSGKELKWRMVEVKSATSVKDYYHDDIAIQSFVAREAGAALATVSLAYVDNEWVYPGNQQYKGLLKEQNMDDSIEGRDKEVKKWIREAQTIIAKTEEPDIRTGVHCTSPYECGFIDYCSSQEKQAKYPVSWLPRASQSLKQALMDEQITDMRKVPDELLNTIQLRVKECTLKKQVYFDKVKATKGLVINASPVYFLDFETINLTVPIWKGTRPYQFIPFQFSVHKLAKSGSVTQKGFLDLTGNDPRLPLAEALIKHCGENGVIYAYNASFERGVIEKLALCFPHRQKALRAINERIEDLLPIMREHYYHPEMHGSWSLKAVLPTIAPELDYSALDGVQDGGMAMEAFQEAIHQSTTPERKKEIEQQLLVYCEQDTLGLVKLWQFITQEGKAP